jgi:endonuclease/exonuclease/phosphatase family metal-dependent hydrolase
MTLKIVTQNLLIDLDQWDLRGPLIVSALSDLSADIILFQEVPLKPDNATWIASQLQGYQVFIAPDAGMKIGQEGLAILTRLPVSDHVILDLGTQNRKAQIIHLAHAGQKYAIANTHLFWHNGHAPERLAQAQQILAYLKSLPEPTHFILSGDFNATPDSPTIQWIKQYMRSAYEACHDTEADSTFPTPLQRDWHFGVAQGSKNWTLAKQKTTRDESHMTIDYIFASPELNVMDCTIVCDQPDPKNTVIYPSDHYGLMAIFEPIHI